MPSSLDKTEQTANHIIEQKLTRVKKRFINRQEPTGLHSHRQYGRNGDRPTEENAARHLQSIRQPDEIFSGWRL